MMSIDAFEGAESRYDLYRTRLTGTPIVYYVLKQSGYKNSLHVSV